MRFRHVDHSLLEVEPINERSSRPEESPIGQDLRYVRGEQTPLQPLGCLSPAVQWRTHPHCSPCSGPLLLTDCGVNVGAKNRQSTALVIRVWFQKEPHFAPAFLTLNPRHIGDQVRYVVAISIPYPMVGNHCGMLCVTWRRRFSRKPRV